MNLDLFGEKAYRKHLAAVVSLVAPVCNLGPDFADNVYEFETELANTMMKRHQAREYDRYYTNTTLDDLYAKANELRSLEDKEENYPEADRSAHVTQYALLIPWMLSSS